MARADAIACQRVAGEAAAVDGLAALGITHFGRNARRRSEHRGEDRECGRRRGGTALHAQSTNAAGTGFSPTAWRRIAQCMASSPRMLAAALDRLRSRNSGTAPR